MHYKRSEHFVFRLQKMLKLYAIKHIMHF